MKKFVQHHLYSLQISYMEDTRGQKKFRSRQQGQGARDQPAYLEVSVRYEDIVMTLLKSLLTSYEYLITTLEMMSMKELMMDYVMAHLWTIYRSVQRRSPKVRIQPWCCGKTKGTIHFHAYTQMLCFYYGKPGHIVHFCYKPKNNERKKYEECERRW